MLFATREIGVLSMLERSQCACSTHARCDASASLCVRARQTGWGISVRGRVLSEACALIDERSGRRTLPVAVGSQRPAGASVTTSNDSGIRNVGPLGISVRE